VPARNIGENCLLPNLLRKQSARVSIARMRKALLAIAFLSIAISAQTPQNNWTPLQRTYLYKVSFIQAAPGKLLELIDLQKDRNARANFRNGSAFMMRHSQGDRWDLMLVAPAANYGYYYSPESIRQRAALFAQDDQKFRDDIAWQEDLFVFGPPIEEVSKNWKDAGFFHVEIFQSLPGKQTELVKEREMENAYLHKLGQPTNLVFTRDQGAAWDCFTIGFYRDLQHYAESAKAKPEDAEAAAKSAGFQSAKDIGPYLRTLIALHHDTLAVAVK
jgi:hypothetical protein